MIVIVGGGGGFEVVSVEVEQAHLGSKLQILVSFCFSIILFLHKTSIHLQIQYKYSKCMYFFLSHYYFGQCLRCVHFEPFLNLGLMYNMQSVFS